MVYRPIPGDCGKIPRGKAKIKSPIGFEINSPYGRTIEQVALANYVHFRDLCKKSKEWKENVAPHQQKHNPKKWQEYMSRHQKLGEIYWRLNRYDPGGCEDRSKCQSRGDRVIIPAGAPYQIHKMIFVCENHIDNDETPGGFLTYNNFDLITSPSIPARLRADVTKRLASKLGFKAKKITPETAYEFIYGLDLREPIPDEFLSVEQKELF